jgi:hypothetical protein
MATPSPKTYNRYQRQLKLDPQACQILDQLAAGPGMRGRYVSNLILMEYARQQERQRLREAVALALGDEEDGGV